MESRDDEPRSPRKGSGVFAWQGLLQELAGHDQALDLVGALVDLGVLRCTSTMRVLTDDKFVRARSYSELIWKPALVAGGVIPAPEKDLRARKRSTTSRKEGLHQLRLYYASVMLAGAVSIKELAEYLGHADPGFTLRVYAHMMPGSHDRARKAIEDRLFHPHAIS
ncbi:hypothetical protein [Microtetraspora malaysiensis]|uniref:hypothetical protein n=1 Tax=Microtetraspora malaysiensis TaxID=161358 RepID=UPI003D93B6B1